jgi:alkanesulfonate monooxygenase SsuD/methylene tetrahydromethanopterin reductase-like flavin-dependent oxidoreductase (luciferase family)
VRRAAEIADAWYCPPFPTHRELVDLHRMYEARGEELGRPVPTDFPVRREVFVADTATAAQRLAADAMRARYETYRTSGLDLEHDGGPEWWDSRIVAGDASLVVDRLHQLIETVPMTHLVLRAHWVGQSHIDSMRHLERLGSHVLARLD